jgi:hypothetical protein
MLLKTCSTLYYCHFIRGIKINLQAMDNLSEFHLQAFSFEIYDNALTMGSKF